MSESPPQSEPRGTIRDRGYQPWKGTLTPAGGRFALIAGRSLGMTARQAWVIVLLILPLLPALVYAVLIWIKVKLLHASGGTILPEGLPVGGSPDDYVFDAICGPTGTVLAFLMALFAGGGAIADDSRAGAFQFYFARPVTREQYLAGKLLPTLVLVGIVATVPGFLLGLLRVGLAAGSSEALHALALPAKALALGALEALAFGVPAVALSSLSRRRGYVQAAFAGVFLLPWMLALTLMRILRAPWPALLSIRLHVANIGRTLFDVPIKEGERWLPVGASLAFLALLLVASILVLRKRLAAAEVIAG